MIIHKTVTSETEDSVKIEAPITWESEKLFVKTFHYQPPTTLWYEIPKKFKLNVNPDLSPFLLPLLPVALYWGEDIFIEGDISYRLYANLKEYQRLLLFWFPQWYQNMIDINPSGFVEVGYKKTTGALSSFSGGVDSTFTVWKHLPRNEPLENFQVTYAMYLWGFERAEDDQTSRYKIKHFSEMLGKNGVTLLPVRTNAQLFHRFKSSLTLYSTFGAILAGGATLLDDLYSTFYFSSDNTYDFPIFSNVHHLIMPLLSTEKVEILPYGASYSRLDKVKAIADWPDTYQSLVTCNEEPFELTNCGTCLKCVDLMAVLDMAGVLSLYTNFPPLCRKQVRSNYNGLEYIAWQKKWVQFGFQTKRIDMIFDYSYTIVRCYLNYGLKTILHDPWLSPLCNPTKYLYKLSFACKRWFPPYASLVRWVKSRPNVLP